MKSRPPASSPEPASDSEVTRRTTLRDIAQEVGVSVNAVSSVLNPRRSGARVGDETRKAILATAHRLNYHRNVAASLLAGGVSRTLGILMARMGGPYDGPVSWSFEQEATRRGYQCFVGCLHPDGKLVREYIHQFLGHGVEGLLLCTVWNDPVIQEALRSELGNRMPVVYVDYGWETIPGSLVCGDHYRGGFQIGEHLSGIGHTCIGLFSFEGSPVVSSIVERMQGVRDAFLQQPGNKIREVSVPHGTRVDLGSRAAKILKKHREITALVCDNDVSAQALILSLNSCGISVPGDIAVTGYDDVLAAFAEEVGLSEHEVDQMMSTPLTTVRQPLHRIGKTAAELLISRIEQGSSSIAKHHVLDVELVIRTSSRLPEWAAKEKETV